MKRRHAVTLLLVGVFCFGVVQPVRADWLLLRNVYDGAFTVPVLSWYYFSFTAAANQKIVFDFTVTAGGNLDIDFFICDETNYNVWSSGGVASVYMRRDRTVSLSDEFTLPSGGRWYIVFSNVFSLISTKTVSASIDLYYWEPMGPTYWNTVIMASIVVVIIVITIVVIIFLVKRSRRSPVTPSEPPQVTQKAVCLHCNQNLAGNETFCGNCGEKV